VVEVEYHWEDAREAGSDHGLVWARLRWDEGFVAPAGKDFQAGGGAREWG